jgi:NADH:ubiquinone oxidoreductase subunit 3 (subunit A)
MENGEKMSHFILMPPIAFLVYLMLVGVLSGMGRILAGAERPNSLKSSLYTGGEVPTNSRGVPGYRPFFVIALFFAVLHLGVLMLGSSGLTALSGIYLLALLLVLIALILG